ncbi:sensor histidine kinase [Boudabousia marimammalium]|uniref:sensor histidine kinase n=1 Tax=Boudabousia marimammalium TaxID=156892 RepID=UPI000A4F7C92|nr:sensor histidine kinase [Boudabousia marimammalium]
MSGRELPPELAELPSLLAHAQQVNQRGLSSLRATVNNVHPKVLSDIGLEAAVRDVAERSRLRVEVRVPHELPQLPEGVVAAAYFLVAEALTNISKYAPSAAVTVLLATNDSLRVSVADDGPGGAWIRPGGGLAGMRERLASFGGSLSLSSPPGGPTVLRGEIPLLLRAGEPGVVV